MAPETNRRGEGVDSANRVSLTLEKVRRQFPDDEVLLATSANVLRSDAEGPVGWSLSRLLQIRCNVVFTDQRVFLESSLKSWLLVLWWAMALYSLTSAVRIGSPLFLVAVPGALAFSFQRRPFRRCIAYTDLRKVDFGEARGIAARADLLRFTSPQGGLHVALAKGLPDALRERLLAGARD